MEYRDEFRPVHGELAENFRHRLANPATRGWKKVVTDSASEWGDALLKDVLAQRGTDVHLVPDSEGLQVRFRVDGIVHDVARLEHKDGQRLIRHFKVMAEMDPTATFKPLVARRAYELEDHQRIELRLATTPTVCGESLAIRVLNQSLLADHIDQLGLAEEQQKELLDWLDSSTGMLLITGPTGSGKSTTLYVLLRRLREREWNVVTLEDPIEYQIDGIAQTQVDMPRELDFASGVRSSLRLDPDFLLVGEIRDAASADAVMEASTSGRAVMSTLHTRDAVGTITSLRNQGLKDHEIGTTLDLVVTQRLVRKLCPHCARTEAPNEEESRWLEALDLPVPRQTWRAAGCDRCRGIGFQGRTGIFEVWRLRERDYHQILEHVPERALREDLAARGHRPLLASGLRLVAEGVTTLGELRSLGGFYVPPPRTAATEELVREATALDQRTEPAATAVGS